MSVPLVSVLFISYKRIDLLKRTVQSFLENTHYPNLELILCDDGSPPTIQGEMKKLKIDKFLFTQKNEGMAANVNKGILAASGEYILQLQDDWVCKGPKDYLTLGVKALEENSEVGIIRYRLGIKYPKFITKTLRNGINRINVLDWDQGDKDISRFIYSDNPHLKRAALQNKIGLYKSFNKMHLTEIEFCERFNNSKLFTIAYLDGYDEVFEHIGDKFSLRKKELHYKIKDILATNAFTKKLYLMVRNYKYKK